MSFRSTGSTLERGVSEPRVSVSGLGEFYSGDQEWSLDWGVGRRLERGEGGWPYLGPRHLRTSGMHLQLRESYSGRQEWFLTGLGVGRGLKEGREKGGG